MLFIKAFALITINILLVACGSSSNKDTPKATGYDLTPYQGRSVNSSSIEGTWVSVGVTHWISTDPKNAYKESIATREFFIIENIDGEFIKSKLSDGNQILITGNTITYDGLEGTLLNNTSFEINNSGDVTDTLSVSSQLNAVKISDTTTAFGTISASSSLYGPQEWNIDHYLVSTVNVDDETSLEKIITSGIEIYYSNEGSELNLPIFNDDQYNTHENHEVTFEQTILSDTSEDITFSASDETSDVTGRIYVSLP